MHRISFDSHFYIISTNEQVMDKIPEEIIIEGNKIISTFMGWSWKSRMDGSVEFYYTDRNYQKDLRFIDDENHINEFALTHHYHKSWDRLFPVYFKIGTMWRWEIGKFGCKIFSPSDISNAVVDSNSPDEILYAAWITAVQFCKLIHIKDAR
jgi:hypothetical protein